MKLRVTGHKSRQYHQYRWKEGEVSVLLAQSLIFYHWKWELVPIPTPGSSFTSHWLLAIPGSSWAICCVHLKGHRHWVEDILHLIWPFHLVEDASTHQTGVYYMISSVLLCWPGSRRERERTHQFMLLKMDHLIETLTQMKLWGKLESAVSN